MCNMGEDLPRSARLTSGAASRNLPGIERGEVVIPGMDALEGIGGHTVPMADSEPMASREEIARSLMERAKELWGQERAEAIGPLIDQTAGCIWQISQDLPPSEEEPGFYF